MILRIGFFGRLKDAVGVSEGLGWEEWRVVALERYEEDPGLESLVAVSVV